MHTHKDKHLIIFLIPPKKIINGGVMSIFSLCKESRRFYNIHHSDVILSVYPGYKSYRKNDLFENDEYIYSFKEALKTHNTRDITLHIPEYALKELVPKFESSEYKDINFTINILNQNIKMMPDLNVTSSLFGISKNITQTIAHNRYASQAIADHYAIPTHLLSVYLDQHQYKQVPYSNKHNTILFSPDGNIHKDNILSIVREKLPQYDLVEINNLTYDQYKQAIASAKFVITFGEGFDGYLIESSMSGTISMAVYNDDFFPSPDYKNVPGIYASYDAMTSAIVEDIVLYDDADTYTKTSTRLLNRLTQIYRYDKYITNLKKFYEGHYSYLPSAHAFEQMFATAVLQKDKLLYDYMSTVDRLNTHIDALTQSNHEYDVLLHDAQNQLENMSKSYNKIMHSKTIRTLRSIHHLLSKARRSISK